MVLYNPTPAGSGFGSCPRCGKRNPIPHSQAECDAYYDAVHLRIVGKPRGEVEALRWAVDNANAALAECRAERDRLARQLANVTADRDQWDADFQQQAKQIDRAVSILRGNE